MKYRSRVFNLLLYPEDESHMEALDIIRKNYDYCAILHDHDLDEAGELKKAHYHVVLRCGNAVWNTALASQLAIPENYIQKAGNVKNSVLYLIHYNNPEKMQYEPSAVEGSMRHLLVKYVQDDQKDESEKVSDILSWLDGQGYVTLRMLSEYCATVGLWSEFRRSAIIFIKLLEEHNNFLKK